jgi:hypothetical protein
MGSWHLTRARACEYVPCKVYWCVDDPAGGNECKLQTATTSIITAVHLCGLSLAYSSRFICPYIDLPKDRLSLDYFRISSLQYRIISCYGFEKIWTPSFTCIKVVYRWTDEYTFVGGEFNWNEKVSLQKYKKNGSYKGVCRICTKGGTS